MSKIKYDYDTQVEVFSSESYLGDKVPSKLEEAIKFFQEKLKSIPEEYRKDTILNIEGYDEYDCAYARVEIYYHRPPTPQEVTDRQEAEKIRAKVQLQWARDNLKRLEKQAEG